MIKEKTKEDTNLLSTRIVDLVLNENWQIQQARRSLGEKATEARVKAEAAKRMERAREIDARLVKPLGTSDRPYPMWGSQRIDHGDDSGSSLQQVLSVIADDTHPLKVYSERSYKEVVAMAYCDMPVPSMLPLFFDGLERRKPESTNRTQMMIGEPGAGKSFMGGLQGRLRSKKPIEVFDCGGKNMNELLFEMVLDFGSGDALPDAIDKRLKSGSMKELSLGLIEQFNTLEAMPADVAADAKAASEWTEKHTVVTHNSEGAPVIDWEKLRAGGSEKIEKAYDLLMKIRNIEGLDKGGGNALGMNSQYGPLIKWFIEGREGVLDEYNKSKEGTDNALQTVWQFLNGEINVCTVENPLKNKDLSAGPSSFTFRREEMQAGFFVTLTGNKTEDGLTTRSLNKSVYSRLSPQTLPDATVPDWQHRICQMMVGMPVSTLYHAFQDQADANPKEFGEWLMSLRKAKADIEGAPVPELQETQLQNWQDVVKSSEQLAVLFSGWADMTNADKLIASGNTDLIEEVDEEYSKKEGMDFRKIKQILEVVTPIRPRMLPAGSEVRADFRNFDKQPVLAQKEPESLSVSYGTRLVDFIERMVFEKSEAVGKKELYKKLQTLMDTSGLRNVRLTEGARSGQKSVEEYLNMTVYDSSDLGRQATAARKVFCDYIRAMDKMIQAEDEQIITVPRLKKTLAEISEKNTAETKELFVVNRDHESLGYAPLVEARIEDTATFPQGQGLTEFNEADIVDHDDFMAALALPTVSGKNLAAIWDTNIRPLMTQGDEGDAAIDDVALEIAENNPRQDIAITTLRVLFKDAAGEVSAVPVHIVLDTKLNKALVVSEKAPDALKNAFNEAGIIHVDRHAPNAKANVERGLNILTRGMKEEVKSFLRDAFGYRHDILSDSRPLSALMVDSAVEGSFFKFVLKNEKRPTI